MSRHRRFMAGHNADRMNTADDQPIVPDELTDPDCHAGRCSPAQALLGCWRPCQSCAACSGPLPAERRRVTAPRADPPGTRRSTGSSRRYTRSPAPPRRPATAPTAVSARTGCRCSTNTRWTWCSTGTTTTTNGPSRSAASTTWPTRTPSPARRSIRSAGQAVASPLPARRGALFQEVGHVQFVVLFKYD